MDDFDVAPLDPPNLNSCMLAGVVQRKVERAGEQPQGLRFSVRYGKDWGNGHKSTLEIPCSTSSQHVETLRTWLKPGVVVVKGEVSRRGTAGEESNLGIYARRVERMSPESTLVGGREC